MTSPAQVYLCALREPVKLPQQWGLVSLSRLALTAILVIPSEVEESQKKMTKLEELRYADFGLFRIFHLRFLSSFVIRISSFAQWPGPRRTGTSLDMTKA